MAGTFSKSALPVRPGAYFNFSVKAQEPALVNPEGTVALVFTHSWGPLKQVVALDSWADFLSVFGVGSATPGVFTPGYRAVKDTFKGEGLPGFGGAGRVLAYRIGGSAAAKASRALQNTAPAAAITLTAVYEGAYGGNIKVEVVANATNPSTHNDLVIYVEDVEVERYTHTKTDITDLAAQINGTTPYTARTKSDWVVASSVTTGTALATIAATALTGGNDGTTTVAGDYSAAQSALEVERFSVLAFDGITDSTINTALKAWAVGTGSVPGLNKRGKRFVTVVGGLAGETMTTAITRSGTFNDENFVNVGCGTYTDDEWGDLASNQLVGRIAGIIAQRGVKAEITFARLQGLRVKVGATEAELLSALNGGVVGIGRDSHRTAPTRLELGITTYADQTAAAQAAKPYDIYSVLKFIRTMHRLETDITAWAEEEVIGRMQVNAKTREFIVGQLQARLQVFEEDGVILPGWSVAVSQQPPPSDLDNFVSIDYSLDMGRGLSRLFNTVVVG